MDSLLVLKEQIIKFYSRFETYINPVLKFLVTLILMLIINANVGFNSRLKNPLIALIISLLCSFMPVNVIIVIIAAVVVGHMYTLSLPCAAVVALIFILMFVLYFHFTPKEAIAVLLTPICFAIKIPYLLPLVMGYVGGPLSCISVVCGTVAYYMMHNIRVNAEQMSGTEGLENALSSFRYVIDTLLKNNSMVLTIISFCITIVVIYLIRRLSVNYAWFIALGFGAVLDVLILLIGTVAIDADISAIGVILGSIVSAALTLVLIFFIHNLDYSRTENLEFEDDEYYYYVKAVPKIILEEPQNTVRRINPQQTGRSRRETLDE